MKTHTTNAFDTFIEVAEDTKMTAGTKPLSKAKRTVAEMQYDLISNHPYQYTSDDVLFQVYADRNGLIEAEYEQARAQFFSKGQACLRASPLTKTYGFGIHSDDHGKVALYGMETDAYQKFLADSEIKNVKAMRSSR
ncbi:DUF6157 family protein [Parapedobacter sp. 10938]|uniref:DUF6157 family protein n=1 Tax=Parapedobacter flavus TaxID=3110225 RepID=UPI002DB90304|nr:DUF6157 family protein [Parapedobacter sp. 10938]MEC3880909.1 DUF6157 family protein [Parapedobacter sp. 10938]